MKVFKDSPHPSAFTRQVPAPASAVQPRAPNDFESMVQRFVAYKPQHQFKILAARLKLHQQHAFATHGTDGWRFGGQLAAEPTVR